MSDYLLLTGCTGLLGRYLLRDLLLEGRRVAVIVRPARKESAAARVEAILQMWENELGQMLPRPVCLEGNVCEPEVGLDVESRTWVAEHCNTMLHSAASLTFHADGSGEPDRTNIEGTQNVLNLCQSAAINVLHYVSTAYVCGLREELVMEDDLDFGQEFRNDYERTKLTAEKLVRCADFLKQLTIYRPAVIAGDSQTGYTNTYHGLYMYLKLMSVLVRNTEPGPDGVRFTPVRLNMTGEEPRNIIPVDWVSAVMCHLLKTPEAHGKTFHIAPEKPLTPRQIIEAGYTYFNSRGVEFVGQSPTEGQPISEMDRDAHDNMGMYKEYEVSDPDFDLTNLHQYAGHLPCPVIDEAMLHRFWKYGEDDRWGKRKSPKAAPCFDVNAHLLQLVDTGEGDPPAKVSDERPVIGIDVIGRGGGQWSLVLDGDRVADVQIGLSGDCHAVFQLSTAQIERLGTPQALVVELRRAMSPSSTRSQAGQRNGSLSAASLTGGDHAADISHLQIPVGAGGDANDAS